MSSNNGVVQYERRSLSIQGTAASPNGTTNTNLIAFTGLATPQQMTINGVPGTTSYPIGTTFVPPLENSGTWINVVNSAAAGTGFKFCRKGIYRVTLAADEIAANAAGAQIGITLDAIAGLDVFATGVVASLSDSVLGWGNILGVAANAMAVVVQPPDLYITDRMAGGAQPSANLTTTRGLGVMRMIINDAAGGEVADTVFTVTSIRATINGVGDINGN